MDAYIPAEEIPPQPKSKLPLILGIVAGVLLLCCCAGVIVFVATGSSISNVFNGVQSGLDTGTAEPSYNDDSAAGTDATGPAGPAEGGHGDAILKGDVWNAIVTYEASQGCDSPVSTAISVIQEPDSDGAWIEAWDVNSCGQSKTYEITFTPNPSGGTNYEIRP